MRALIVTDIFPPVNAVGVQRTLALCRHLAGRGWEVTVLTARPRPGEALDPGLLAKVPASVRLLRTPAPNLSRAAARLLGRRAPAPGAGPPPGNGDRRPVLRRAVDWLSLWLQMPDAMSGWLAPALWAGLRVRPRPDVIYSTAPLWTGQVVGAALSRALGAPLVADFRDPWCGNAWRPIPFAAHRWVDRRLEAMVVRRAAFVTCAWDRIRERLAEHYPERAGAIRTIYNGFDAEQVDAIPAAALEGGGGRCVLLHAGNFYGPRSPEPLLAGLRLLAAEQPAAAGGLLVAFLGKPTYDGRPLADLARERGVEPLVRVLPPTSHREALALTKGAGVALLFGQSGDSFLVPVPGKVYEYVALGKPVLAIGAGEEAAGILRQGGCRLWEVGTGPREIAAALAGIAGAHERRELAPAVDPEGRRSISWASRTSALEAVLEAAARRRA